MITYYPLLLNTDISSFYRHGHRQVLHNDADKLLTLGPIGRDRREREEREKREREIAL